MSAAIPAPWLRSQEMSRLHDDYDVAIIGGGITGAGIALDAVSRGMKVLLLEKSDFASGTSSRSTKLIHGGLRYLKQFELGLVAETGRERAVVHRLAPHLTTPEKMLLPLVEGGAYGRLLTALGLTLYDILAGVRAEDRRVMLSRAQTLTHEPLLNKQRLLGGGLYAEYRTDDARLTLEIIKTAVAMGACCLNYTEVNGLIKSNEKLTGLKVQDKLNGAEYSVKARCIVSAAGPWVDQLRELDGSKQGKTLHLTKGVHIVVARSRLPLQQSVYFDNSDGRMVFAIPRAGVVYIGTTDTDYYAAPEAARCTMADVAYLLAAANNMFPSVAFQPADVQSAWAGLRPLIHQAGKSASELSRKDEIFESPSGLISIAGGKLTGYRQMARRVTDRVGRRLGGGFGPCRTRQLQLCGSGFDSPAALRDWEKQLGLRLTGHFSDPNAVATYLVHLYGTQAGPILDLMAELPETEAGLRLVLAELHWCLRHEMICTPADFWLRRSSRLLFDVASVHAYRKDVQQLMAAQLNWSPEHAAAMDAALSQAIAEATEFPED